MLIISLNLNLLVQLVSMDLWIVINGLIQAPLPDQLIPGFEHILFILPRVQIIHNHRFLHLHYALILLLVLNHHWAYSSTLLQVILVLFQAFQIHLGFYLI